MSKNGDCVEGDNPDYNEDDIFEGPGRGKRGTGCIDLLTSQSAGNHVDRMLFAGITVALTPSLISTNVGQVLQACGAVVVQIDGTADSILRAKLTHIIYAREDKKCGLMLAAAYVISSKQSMLKLIQSN
uniref:Uncharacterized protein n=1 Tax=Lygus hesperus TaxID=30085 RepID=A0A146KV79_LYGHE